MPLPSRGTAPHCVGIIADTHELIRPAALTALSGVDRIIHAGDIGRPEVLIALEAIAPVVAIRGNVDTSDWARGLPESANVTIDGVALYVLHNLHDLNCDPQAAGFHVVISGHSHRPSVAEQGGVLFINPGSAGPRRFRLPISIVLLQIQAGLVNARIVELDVCDSSVSA